MQPKAAGEAQESQSPTLICASHHLTCGSSLCLCDPHWTRVCVRGSPQSIVVSWHLRKVDGPKRGTNKQNKYNVSVGCIEKLTPPKQWAETHTYLKAVVAFTTKKLYSKESISIPFCHISACDYPQNSQRKRRMLQKLPIAYFGNNFEHETL